MGLDGLDGGFDPGDPFAEGAEGGGEPIETSEAAGAETAAAGKETAAETSLTKRMKELGLDDESATRLLGERHEEAEEDRRAEAQEHIHREAQAIVNRDFHGMFMKALNQYIEDPRFQRDLTSMLARRGARIQAPGEAGAGDDTIDPATRTLNEIRNELRAERAAREALEQRLRDGAEADAGMRSYKEGVGSAIEGWARRNAAIAEEFGAEIMADLKDRERSMGGRAFRSEREVRNYLTARAEHYRALDKRLKERQGGNARPGNRVTRPLGGNTGTTRGQAPTSRAQSDLRVPAITAGVLEDMARWRAGDAGGD